MKKIRTLVTAFLAAALSLTLLFPSFAVPQPYEHDPRLDARTMADVVYNPEAVYGFSPSPDSARLGAYLTFDWTDPALVEQGKQERLAYFESISTLQTEMSAMFAAGKSMEEVARTISARRNEIRLAAYKDNPEGLKAAKQSNLEKYGNENGPTADSLFEKYGTWDMVLQKAFSANPGMDACLGLYDMEYEYNVLLGEATPAETAVYIITKGDSLQEIALHYYGDSEAWPRILEANRDRIAKADLIYVGETLVIPVP